MGRAKPRRTSARRRRPTVDAAEQTDGESGPHRRCIVTRAEGRREDMLRFVLGPGRALVPDVAARLPGRGFWLSARADVLETAVRKGHFARAARGPVVVPDGLPALVEAGLRRRIAEHIGLARRAGRAVGGWTRVREWLVGGRASLAVEASDGSEEERARLLSGVRTMVVAWPLPAATLGRIWGRDHAVHVAVSAGALAAAIENDTQRLAGVTGTALLKRIGG